MKELYAQIDKSIIPNLPQFQFSGKIVVVQSAYEAERAVRSLRSAEIVGIDTETRPAFRKGVSHKVALLQVSTRHVCFLFRLNHIGMPKCVQELLMSPSIMKVGLSLNDDFRQLSQRVENLSHMSYVELQDYVSEMGIKDKSLQKLFANVFHRRISKSQQLSNWEADVLVEKQKLYAATDAYACLVLYEELERLRKSGDYRIIENEDITS